MYRALYTTAVVVVLYMKVQYIICIVNTITFLIGLN